MKKTTNNIPKSIPKSPRSIQNSSYNTNNEEYGQNSNDNQLINKNQFGFSFKDEMLQNNFQINSFKNKLDQADSKNDINSIYPKLIENDGSESNNIS